MVSLLMRVRNPVLATVQEMPRNVNDYGMSKLYLFAVIELLLKISKWGHNLICTSWDM